MISHLRRLSHYVELLYVLAWRDIRIRYKQSIMGVLWAVVTPAFVVGSAVVIRAGIARYSGTPIQMEDVASVTVRAVAWTFFTAGLRFGTMSLLANRQLVTKLSFPREVFPLSAVLSSLFDFAIAAAVTILLLVIFGWVPSLLAIWAVPLVAVLAAFTIGLTLLLAATNLFLRDVKYIVEIILNYAIFVTPVLYEASFAGSWEWVLMLNPVAPIMEGLAAALVHGSTPDLRWFGYSLSVSVVALTGGYWTFKKLEPKFAETV